MFVSVWRHGEAGAAPTDQARALTPRGQRSVMQAALTFSRWIDESDGPQVDACWYSPWTRTAETAFILAKTLQIPAVACEALAPGTVLEHHDSYLPAEAEHALIVSHQPFVSRAIWYWLDDDRVAPLMPGGWVTMDMLAPARGGATLVRSETSIF